MMINISLKNYIRNIEYIKDYLFGFCVLNSKFGVNIHNFVKICCNYSKKGYNICILGNCINSSRKGYLQINLSGEQKNVGAKVIEAINLERNISLNCKNNKIFLDNIVKNSKNKVSFRLDYSEECSLEVKLYGYSS